MSTQGVDRQNAHERRADSAQESIIPTLEPGKSLESRFECPICLHCLSEPTLTSCGHRFCKSCITMWLEREGGVCPVDNQPLNSAKDLFPDNFTLREIQDSLRDGMGSQLVECSFRDFGCLSVLHCDEMPSHLESQIHYHMNLLSCAHSKLQQSVQSQKIEIKAQEATNLWEPDAKGQTEHQNGSCQVLMRSLYERVLLLEQQNREQEIQLMNLKQQVREHIDVMSKELALRHCGGVYLWTVSKISAKLAAMQNNPSRCMFYSPGFYTAPNGYRFCARMNLCTNNRSQIALLIHLMRTDHDACLSWPFVGHISFTLVNAKDPSRNIYDTMMSSPELDAFKRPLCECNALGFGYTEFVSVLDLTTQGFITSDDCIVIKLQVASV